MKTVCPGLGVGLWFGFVELNDLPCPNVLDTLRFAAWPLDLNQIDVRRIANAKYDRVAVLGSESLTTTKLSATRFASCMNAHDRSDSIAIGPFVAGHSRFVAALKFDCDEISASLVTELIGKDLDVWIVRVDDDEILKAIVIQITICNASTVSLRVGA